MKKIFCPLAISLSLVFGLASVAQAVQLKLDSYDVTLNSSDPGLVVHWAPIAIPPVVNNLIVGVPISFALFEIWTDESAVNKDDKNPKPIDVSFNFTEPGPAFGGSVDGTTEGKKCCFTGFFQGGSVEWDGPSYLSFGPLGDGLLKISLSDEDFNWGKWWGTKPGERYGAVVDVTLKLKREASPVPEPGTVLLLGSGIMGLGLWRWRKITEVTQD